MTIDVRAARALGAASLTLVALAGSVAARATDDCRILSEGHNDVTGPSSCFVLEIPDGVDLMRLTGDAGGFDVGGTLCRWNSPTTADRPCAVPAPASGPTAAYDYRQGGATYLDVEYEEARPVTGAAAGSIAEGPQDGAMFRFDRVGPDAVIALVGSADLALRVRGGQPPTSQEADCISARASTQAGAPDGDAGARGPDAEACHLGAEDGPVYAFVTWNWARGIQAGAGDPLTDGVAVGCQEVTEPQMEPVLAVVCPTFMIVGA